MKHFKRVFKELEFKQGLAYSIPAGTSVSYKPGSYDEGHHYYPAPPMPTAFTVEPTNGPIETKELSKEEIETKARKQAAARARAILRLTN